MSANARSTFIDPNRFGLAIVATTLFACAAGGESAIRHDLATASRIYAQSAAANHVETGAPESQPAWTQAPQATSATATNLPEYTRLALSHNPALRASFERWQASVYSISKARRLPEPTVTAGYFLRAIETRVGPQRARLGLQQAVPWPTRLSAGAQAATAQAQAMQQRFDAQALAVTERVQAAYWNLWQLRVTRSIHRKHMNVIQDLAETVRARLATGAAMLADLQQLDLTAARIDDNLRAMDEAEHGAEAQLRAAIGVDAALALPTPDEPGLATLPSESVDSLSTAAQTHPMVKSLGHLAEASSASARAEAADRLPTFTLGVDWILTGEAAMPNVRDSGRDAVMVGAGLKLPLWQGSYSDSVQAAEASARAQRAEQHALLDSIKAEFISTYARLRDATRRVALYQTTLVPQAETAYASVLGAYTVGRSTVAQALLAQRDLLELQIERERARADHARTWAQLEALVGRPLAPSPQTQADDESLVP